MWVFNVLQWLQLLINSEQVSLSLYISLVFLAFWLCADILKYDAHLNKPHSILNTKTPCDTSGNFVNIPTTSLAQFIFLENLNSLIVPVMLIRN